MIYSIFSKKDATIYEGTGAATDLNKEYSNTGVDEILEIQKLVSSSATANTYISRILTKFDVDWTKINYGKVWTGSAYLNLYTTEVESLPYSYIITAHPISESWDMGIGRSTNTPYTLDGASWINRTGEHTTGTAWITASFTGSVAGTASNGATNNGGGTWHTSSYGTQTFTNESTDVRMDVKNVLTDWSSSVYTNEGFIVKLSGSQETDSDRYSILKYFSGETHTIYPPRLEMCWVDKLFGTGSLTALDMSDTGAVFFYLKNNRGSYTRGGKIKFWTYGRLRYPVKTYGTTSAELGINYVAENLACYSIKDARTGETVIPFDDSYTTLSCDSTKGNYFEIYSDSLLEERDYKIQLRYRPTITSTDYTYYDIKDTFKIAR